ncbi:MAG: phage tail domain-containing protein [Clostridium sp.]|uniref:phage tail domain-containing protein n=1 Tax=Clostridium sp. TaxID=1506 RepID=UPI003EE79539
MSFYSENFSFDGIGNREMGVMLVSFDDGVLKDCGVKYKETIQQEVTRNNSFYYSESMELEPITLSIVRVDDNGVPMTWDRDSRMHIIDWMVKQEFCPFVSEDDTSIVYYFRCVEYTKKFNASGEGVIELVMQPEDSYVYTPVVDYKYRVNGSKVININCLDNVNDKYYPKMEIIQFDKDCSDVSIRNTTIGNDAFVIKNLKENENVEIDHLLKSVDSNIELFKLKDTNRKWLYLKRGQNEFEITGDCDIRFTVQYALKV